MEPLEFGKFVVQLLQWFWDRVIIITECQKGQAVIKKRFGHPIKWRNKPRWYFKWPFIDMFDKVDTRKKYIQLNAHSFNSEEMKMSIVPYNLIIDFQVEYQVVNPLIIYDQYGFADGEDAGLSYINNKVQSEVEAVILEKGASITYADVCEHFANASKSLNISPYKYSKVTSFDNAFYGKNRKEWAEIITAEESISINNIVATSFDKNISIRNTV